MRHMMRLLRAPTSDGRLLRLPDEVVRGRYHALVGADQPRQQRAALPASIATSSSME
jgi:hypothetical protein